MRQLTPFWYALVHGVISFLVFLIPQFFVAFPELGKLTVGGIAVLIVNYLEHKLSS